MNTELISIEKRESIKEKIFIIRNQKVMLDFHLAEIYGYSTSAFNQQVQRNIEKFDEDFMFQLTRDEYRFLRSQFVTLEEKIDGKGHYSKYLPYAFTESGIYMLMTVLKGELAIEQSKTLIRLFRGMKDYIFAGNTYVTHNEFNKALLSIDERFKETNLEIKSIKKNLITKEKFTKVINELTDNKIKKDYLFLNGNKIKADIAYQSIYAKALKTIYIIDNYISLKTLVLLKNINVNVQVIIFSDNINHGLHKIEYTDFTKEYPSINITFKITNGVFHDRYIIVDYDTKNEIVYHCGPSSKDAGNKVGSVNKVNDNIIYHPIIDKLKDNKELEI